MEEEKLKEALQIIEAEKKSRAEEFLKVIQEASKKYNCDLVSVINIGNQKIEVGSLLNGQVNVEVVPR